jgi:hypothetical protein
VAANSRDGFWPATGTDVGSIRWSART